MTVYKTIYRPILTYGSESWVLSDRLLSRLQATEMKYLRRVKGVTRMDRIRNDRIRELDIESIKQTIEENKLKWFGHLVRMNEERPAKLVLEAKVQGKKRRGRPQKTWNMTVAEALRKRNLTWDEARRIAKDRTKWKKIVQKTVNE